MTTPQLDVVRKTVSTQLLAQHRPALARFIAIQLLRVPRTRSGLMHVLAQPTVPSTMPAQVVAAAALSDTAAHDAFVDDAQTGHIQTVQDRLLCMDWTLSHNLTSELFWTSDYPVTRFNINAGTDEFGNMASFQCAGLQLCLPLTPRLAVILHSPGLGADPTAVDLPEVAEVKRLNAQQLFWCHEEVYALTPDFDWARQLLDSYPEWIPAQHVRVYNEENCYPSPIFTDPAPPGLILPPR